MRIVYYSRPCFLDHFLPQIKVLSRFVELHAVLELSPEGWRSSFFDLSQTNINNTIVDAKKFFSQFFSESIQRYWQHCGSFKLIVHKHPKSIHPKSWKVSNIAINEILRIKPDILHLDDVSLRLAPLLFRIGELPIVLTLHDVRPHLGEENWRRRLGTILTFKRVKHFIVHSEFSRNQFLEQYSYTRKMVSTVPLGIIDVFHEFLREDIHPEPLNSVLFFGRISPYKGVDVFIRALEIVSKKISHCKFIIAGKPIHGYRMPPIPFLSNNGTIEIHDRFLSNKEIAAFIAKSTIIVCPYLDATQSGVVLTAYAFNKPVIATNVGGLPEYVYHNKTGLLVPPGDPNALAEAIIDLLQNPEKRRQMKKEIQRLAKTELSWDRIAERTVEVYEKVLRQYGH